jgi:hypothetical protein
MLSAELSETTYPFFDDLSVKGKAEFEITSKQIGSNYNFSVFSLEATFKKRFGGLGVTELTMRGSTIISGELPRWHAFFFETRSGFFSHQGYFRGLIPFEFVGDRLTSLHLEHNFYDLPTRILGIHFLDRFDLHWLFHVGTGNLDFIGSNHYGTQTLADSYSEIGFGIGNIYNILQLEGTWRLSHRQQSNFYPTLDLRFSF